MLSAAGFWEFDDCFPGPYMLAAVQDTIVHFSCICIPKLFRNQRLLMSGLLLMQDVGRKVVALLVCTCWPSCGQRVVTFHHLSHYCPMISHKSPFAM